MTNMKDIGIIGSGGFAQEVLCLLSDLNLINRFVGFFEPDELCNSQSVLGYSVLPYSDMKSGTELVFGIGNSKVREKIFNELGDTFTYPTYVHPSVVKSKWVEIGSGSVITAGCILTSSIALGRFCQLNLQTTIGHDCEISDYFTTAPSVNISGNCKADQHVYFGTGSATKQGVSICDDVTIGMGAMVTKDIIEPGIYVGIPAKKR